MGEKNNGTKAEVTYFTFCGEVNTEETLRAAKRKCEELGIDKVIIASDTGRSALKALHTFKGTDVKLIVVTHYPATTWGPKGDIPIGLARDEYAAVRKSLTSDGVKIVQGTRPFGPPSRSVEWNYPTPESVIDRTLELFGAGTKIAVEIAIMATDAGEVKDGEEVVSCAGTYKGLDTALVVKVAYSMDFFSKFTVEEVVAKPRCRLKGLPEYDDPAWCGNIEQYYEQDFG